MYYSIGMTTLFILPRSPNPIIQYFSIKPVIHYSLFSFHPRERTSQTSFQKIFQLKTAKLDDISDNAIIGDMKLPKEN